MSHDATETYHCHICRRAWAWRLCRGGRWVRWTLAPNGRYAMPHFRVCPPPARRESATAYCEEKP